jgi:hypothetical protein
LEVEILRLVDLQDGLRVGRRFSSSPVQIQLDRPLYNAM